MSRPPVYLDYHATTPVDRRVLERMGRELAAWNKNKQHEASVTRIRAELASVCAKLPAADPARTTCDGALTPKKA